MTEAVPADRKPARESSRTVLAPTERSGGGKWRRLSFHALLGIASASVVAAAYWWYMWFVTAEACLYAYVLPHGSREGSGQQHSLLSILKNPGSWRECSWRDYFIALDITSIAALTLALFFTYLAWSGIRNTAWRRYRDGKAYFENAYHTGLFSRSFLQLCIQFGLLGTLLSFLLAAVAQIGVAVSKTDATRSSSVVEEPTLAKDVRAIVQEPTHRDAGRVDSLDSGQPRSPDVAAPAPNKELSSDIFLLLCASLVSAFVGAFVAYIVIPPLNGLNDCAVGLYQLDPVDEESTVDEFFRQIDRTSRRLSDLDAAAAALTKASKGVGQFQTATTDASTSLARMMEMLGRSTEVAETSNRRADALAKQLALFQDQSERMLVELRKFVSNELKEPLQWLRKAAISARNSNVAGGRAFEELHKMAQVIGTPLKSATDASHKMFSTVIELRNSLRAVAERENEQSSQIASMAETFQGLQMAIQDLLELLATNVEAANAETVGELKRRHETNGKALATAIPTRQAVRTTSKSSPRAAQPAPRPSLAYWCRLAHRWFFGPPPER
jgi:hypothetical protein